MDYINNMFALSSDLCNFLFSVRETVSKAVFGGNIALGNWLFGIGLFFQN